MLILTNTVAQRWLLYVRILRLRLRASLSTALPMCPSSFLDVRPSMFPLYHSTHPARDISTNRAPAWRSVIRLMPLNHGNIVYWANSVKIHYLNKNITVAKMYLKYNFTMKHRVETWNIYTVHPFLSALMKLHNVCLWVFSMFFNF